MKVGIVTIWDERNLGNRLQNYAMYIILTKKMGFEAVTLRSIPSQRLPLLKRMKERIAILSCMFPNLAAKYFSVETVRYSRFYNWNKQIPCRVYFDTKHIPQTVNTEFDYFVSGSDQIWNYTFSSGRFYDYFLQFADTQKRVAVSASIGLNSIGPEWKDYFSEKWRLYKTISVREEKAKEIVEELSGREATVISDPVMVLSDSDWRKVSKKPKVDLSKKYILVYMLGTISEEVKEKIEHWKNEGNCVVYNMLDKKDINLYTCGPAEFLSLIDNASLIVTDSFHCSAFSILFSKPFVVVKRNDGYQDRMGSRLDTLLQKYELCSRREESVNDVFLCDFSHTKAILKKERKKFMDFLHSSLTV